MIYRRNSYHDDYLATSTIFVKPTATESKKRREAHGEAQAKASFNADVSESMARLDATKADLLVDVNHLIDKMMEIPLPTLII